MEAVAAAAAVEDEEEEGGTPTIGTKKLPVCPPPVVAVDAGVPGGGGIGARMWCMGGPIPSMGGNCMDPGGLPGYAAMTSGCMAIMNWRGEKAPGKANAAAPMGGGPSIVFGSMPAAEDVELVEVGGNCPA